MKALVEICCDGIAAARRAVWRGAERIELCHDLSCGGITPAYTEIYGALSLGRPVNVLVRPRGGNFVYSDAEVEKMSREIACCGEIGLNGVVLGALTPEGAVDMDVCRDLIALARSYELSVTFHRAIDEAADIFSALAQVLELGVDRVLTSGGASGAFEGRGVIAEMVRRACGRCIVMPGGGVTAENAEALVECTGASEIHGSRTELLELPWA